MVERVDFCCSIRLIDRHYYDKFDRDLFESHVPFVFVITVPAIIIQDTLAL